MSSTKQAASHLLLPQRSAIGNALIDFRARKGWSQRGLAAAIGVTQGAVSQWEMSGTEKSKRVEPTPMALLAIANLDDDRRMWWLEQAGPMYARAEALGSQYKKEEAERTAASAFPDAPAAKSDSRPIHVYGQAGAGPFLFIDENKMWEIELPKKWFTGMGEIAGVVVAGDSMQPLIQSGHIVILDLGRRTPAACLDRIVAVGDGEGVTVKWLRKGGGGYLLVPHNQAADHPVVPVKAHHRIIGCAVRWIAQAPYTFIAEGEGDRAHEKAEGK